jgi:exodeoxyribonuclease X
MTATPPPKVLLRVVDCETGGFDPHLHDVVELGWTDVVFEPATKAIEVGMPHSKLFGAPRGIPPETQAVHHITPKMVAGLPPFTANDIQKLAAEPGAGGLVPMFMVAHNAEFDRQWLATDGVYWICTMKVARRQIPSAPSHGNQALRYFLDLDIDPAVAEPPHRAGPDSYVTAHLAAYLIARVGSLSQMEAWTRAPLFYPTCPLKKHRGQPWSDVPADYLQWMLRQPDKKGGRSDDGMEPDLKAAAQEELDIRREAATAHFAKSKPVETGAPESPA